PEGLRSVTPFLHPQGASKMIEFLKAAFFASETSRTQSPQGRILHAVVTIGDSALELGDAHGTWQPLPATFYLYVDDVDGWYRRAIDAGAASIAAPANQQFGDRSAAVSDPFGNKWYMA